MKKWLYTIPVLITIFNCSSSLVNCRKTSNKAEIQFITDGGCINDRSFNQQGYEAVEEFALAHNITYSYKTPLKMHDKTEYINSYKAAIASNAKLFIASGCLQQQALTIYAKDHKEKQFISCDFALGTNDISWVNDGHDNCAQLTYKAEQSGFFAGISACCYLNANIKDYNKNNTGLKIATFGGMDIAAVTNFMAGFQSATVWWNNNLQDKALRLTQLLNHQTNSILAVENISASDEFVNNCFTGSFELGAAKNCSIIERLVRKGADIIFPVAGVQTQDVINFISNKNKVNGKTNIKIIGVDTDQSIQYPNNKELIITSALKEIKYSLMQVLEAWKKDNNDKNYFTKTAINGGYEKNWIGIAQTSYITKLLIDEINKLTNEAEQVSKWWNSIIKQAGNNSLWKTVANNMIVFD